MCPRWWFLWRRCLRFLACFCAWLTGVAAGRAKSGTATATNTPSRASQSRRFMGPILRGLQRTLLLGGRQVTWEVRNKSEGNAPSFGTVDCKGVRPRHNIYVTGDTDSRYLAPAESTPPIRGLRVTARRGRFSMSGRLDPKLLISKRLPRGLASRKTRPPLLSSATRPGFSGAPDGETTGRGRASSVRPTAARLR